MPTASTPPDAELLLASGCAHCPAVLASLSEMVKQGQIGRLEVANVEHHPELAQARGARGVPWTRIGPFILPGAYTKAELLTWAERAGSPSGMAEYFVELLQTQRLDEALQLVLGDPGQLSLLVEMMGDLDTPMGARIGISALFEDLAEQGKLQPALSDLVALSQSPHQAVRGDAAYLLGLLGEPAHPALHELAQDKSPEVREIAAEALQADD